MAVQCMEKYNCFFNFCVLPVIRLASFERFGYKAIDEQAKAVCVQHEMFAYAMCI